MNTPFITGFYRRLVLLIALAPAASIAGETVRNNLGMVFVNIPAGSFSMGTTEKDRQRAIAEMPRPDADAFVDEQPVHAVEISRPFLLGQTEVTQGQWLKVMENRPGPEEYWQRQNWENLPVVSVSWLMAKRFVEELGKMDKQYRYRLPTEAEWEYAARAGTSGLRPVPVSELADIAWYIETSGDHPHPVASLKANGFGLHDMLGNVWEWVDDWYAPDSYADGSLRRQPAGPPEGRSKVRRGGSYHCPLFQTRPGYRSANTPDTRYSVIGLRVVAVPVSQP